VAIHHNASLARKRAAALAAVGARRSSFLAHMLSDPGLGVGGPVNVESVFDLGHSAAGVEVAEGEKRGGAGDEGDGSVGKDEGRC
jgi:hypothetical protein